MALNTVLTATPGKTSLAWLSDDRMQLRGEALTDQYCRAGKQLMNHRAPSGSLGEVWEEREAQAVQGSPSDARWETAIHLPDVTTPSTSATKLKTIAVLGHEKVTCISLGATLSAKKRKSCADSNVTRQSWVTRNQVLVILQTQQRRRMVLYG